jgi:hypothetical protein
MDFSLPFAPAGAKRRLLELVPDATKMISVVSGLDQYVEPGRPRLFHAAAAK